MRPDAEATKLHTPSLWYPHMCMQSSRRTAVEVSGLQNSSETSPSRILASEPGPMPPSHTDWSPNEADPEAADPAWLPLALAHAHGCSDAPPSHLLIFRLHRLGMHIAHFGLQTQSSPALHNPASQTRSILKPPVDVLSLVDMCLQSSESALLCGGDCEATSGTTLSHIISHMKGDFRATVASSLLCVCSHLWLCAPCNPSAHFGL